MNTIIHPLAHIDDEVCTLHRLIDAVYSNSESAMRLGALWGGSWTQRERRNEQKLQKRNARTILINSGRFLMFVFLLIRAFCFHSPVIQSILCCVWVSVPPSPLSLSLAPCFVQIENTCFCLYILLYNGGKRFDGIVRLVMSTVKSVCMHNTLKPIYWFRANCQNTHTHTAQHKASIFDTQQQQQWMKVNDGYTIDEEEDEKISNQNRLSYKYIRNRSTI